MDAGNIGKHPEIETVDIQSLNPYEFNNRIHKQDQIDLILKSIKEFGYNQPIVVDENSEILVGHARYAAFLQAGMDEVQVVRRKNLTEEQKRAYRILDNKLQEDSSWHFDNLNLEIDWLEDQEFPVEDWKLTELRTNFDDDVDTSEDQPVKKRETNIKLGDLIELGNHRVLCGDSTSASDVNNLLADSIPILMVTDPPYGVEYDPSWRNDAAESGHLSYAARSIGEVNNDNRSDWSDTYQLFDCQVVYIWHDGLRAREISEHLDRCGYEIISQIIWAKNTFAISRGDYHWQHESCWYAVKKGKTHNWQGSRSQSTLWEIDRGCSEKTGHSTEKPIECMARPIRNNSKRNDLVADPFLGSGTTLIACERLDRTCYGIEIEPSYCQVVIDRYKNECERTGKEFVCTVNGKPYEEIETETTEGVHA